ncbi:unnamed protein product [Nezara viridula]|uniref:Uncharacterized protein n=1 Tax=Nezara viridula TaxID=85310 RepID=A0A9P0MK02_NEZVI|nr:unnamed protein product [Nezara viridula]
MMIKRHARRPWRHWPPWKERQLTTVYYFAATTYQEDFFNLTTESTWKTEVWSDWRNSTMPTTSDTIYPLKHNLTVNRTELEYLDQPSLTSIVCLCIVLCLITLGTIVGEYHF